MLNGLKYVYMNQNRFSERIGASWRRETSFGGLGGQKRVTHTPYPTWREWGYDKIISPKTVVSLGIHVSGEKVYPR